MKIFSLETERFFARVLDLAIDNEVKAEAVRQRLSRRPLFNTYDAFKAIDKYNQGFIVLEDLKEILEDNGIFATNKDVDLLVERFKGPDAYNGKITYSEFSKELSPKSHKIY
jgi:Ca2+-binding EF-hand superfamily protein